MIMSESGDLRIQSAANPNTSPDVLEVLSNDQDPEIRCAVAWNQSTTPQILKRLASDEDEIVRFCVSGNLNASFEVVDKLAKDESSFVRKKARYGLKEFAENPNTSPKILKSLATDEDSNVRADVAKNPNTSLAVLESLARDEDTYVRGLVAGAQKTSIKILEFLAKDEAAFVRSHVAESSLTNLDMLGRLAQDEDEDVRAAVARNPNTLPTVLESLTKESTDHTRTFVEEVSDVDPELSEDFIENEGETIPFPGRNSLIEERVSHFFSEGIALCYQNKHQEGSDIFFELAYDGHLDSINELVHMFLDQRNFKVVKELLECYPDANNPTILFLRAKMVEAVANLDNLSAEALNAYEKAAIAGSAHAALTLVEEYATKDRLIARKWFSRAKEIGHPKLQYFNEMLSTREKQFTIVIGRDNSGGLTQVSVFRYGTEALLRDFDSISEATNFCITSQGGFDFQENPDESEVFSADYHIKVFTSTNEIKVAEADHDYWFGDLSDKEAAIEELLSRDCSWDLVFYDSIEQEVEVPVNDNPEDTESDSDFVDLSPEDFTLAGFFSINSGRTYIGDPGDIEEFLKRSAEENDVWTAYEGLNIFDFGTLSSTSEKTGIVYVEENDEGRIVKALISFDGKFENSLPTADFVVGNWLAVGSGQLMVGDPNFLEHWDPCNGEVWNLEGKIGKFSYQGASATTIAYNFGVLADGKSVVFNTGYGDGNYYVFFLIKNQSGKTLGLEELQEAGYIGWLNGFATGVPPGCEISKVVIDFITEVE